MSENESKTQKYLIVCGNEYKSVTDAVQSFIKENPDYIPHFLTTDNVNIDLSILQDPNTILMKGSWNTQKFMRFVLKNITSKTFLFHVGMFFNKNINRLLLMSDGALNIHMNMEQKLSATLGMINIFKSIKNFGLTTEDPVVGLITPSGQINPKIQSSIDALYVQQMLSPSETIYIGSFDTLISKENAAYKGISQDKNANCLLCDNLDQANTLWKSLTNFGGFITGGVVLGAPFKIVLTSRTDSVESKLLSLNLAHMI